jgi:hypothetical protein
VKKLQVNILREVVKREKGREKKVFREASERTSEFKTGRPNSNRITHALQLTHPKTRERERKNT